MELSEMDCTNGNELNWVKWIVMSEKDGNEWNGLHWVK